MIKKLLYLTYITLDDAPKTGSSVRPLKMKEAFESLNIELKVFGGANNNISVRKTTVMKINKLLNVWKPDACYIEPPSGPFFYYGDVILIKRLHRMGIPTAIFYRDAYWKYPEYSAEKRLSYKEWIKRFVVKMMQLHQWSVFKKKIDLIYFPSQLMAKEFECPRKDVLPPGGFLPAVREKAELSTPIQFIFVGGAARNYGTFLTIDAFEKLNKMGVIAKLIYICPESQWNALGIDKEKHKEWLEINHTSGDEKLKYFYERSDVALLTAPRTFYRDFAVPVKLFEYISYLKPVVVTDCIETAKVVNENRCGWVTNDDVDSVTAQLQYLCDHPQEILEKKREVEEARKNNLWVCRAEKVIFDLDNMPD